MPAVVPGAAEPDRIDRDLVRLAGVLLIGAIAALLDTTIVMVAIADLGAAFDARVTVVQWVTTAYLLAMATAIPLMGWLVDRLGATRVWMGAISLFLAGSMLCSVAWSIESLIVFRVVQGLGGGLILPLVQAILIQAAGPNRIGRVLSLVGIPGQLAPILGPVLGGVLLASVGWRWIFLVNIPICVTALLLAHRHLPADSERVRTRLDGVGLLLLVPALVAVLFGLSTVGDGAGLSPPAVLCVVAGTVLLVGFALHARRAGERALLDVRLFGLRSFTTSAVLMFLFGMSLYGPLLLLPLFFQQVRGHSVAEVGVLLVPQGMGTMVALWLAGRATDLVGPRRVALTGMALSGTGMAIFAVVGRDASVVTLSVALLLLGAGLGTAGVGVSGASYRGIARATIPRATSLLNVTQRLGASFGTASVALVLQHRVAALPDPGDAAGLATAFSHAFWWTLAVATIAVLPRPCCPAGTARGPAPRRTARSPSGPRAGGRGRHRGGHHVHRRPAAGRNVALADRDVPRCARERRRWDGHRHR